MLERAAKLVPLGSVGAFIVLAVFNLGYFWPIGLHFIGLVDLTNLAYALGLSISSLLFVAGIGLEVFRNIEKQISTKKLMSRLRTAKGFVVVGGIMVLGAIVAISFFDVHLGLSGALFFYGSVLVGAGWVFKMSLSRQLDRGTHEDEVVFLFCVFLAAAFGAGLFKANLELSSKATYRIVLKSEAMDGVQILRSSSNGFIVAKDRVVSFVPQSEVVRVVSNEKTK